jgi:hypothetical protein
MVRCVSTHGVLSRIASQAQRRTIFPAHDTIVERTSPSCADNVYSATVMCSKSCNSAVSLREHTRPFSHALPLDHQVHTTIRVES